MKKVYILFITVALLALGGCNDFLNLKPRDTKIVSTIEDYRDIMASYMRLLKTPNGEQKPVFGGNFLYPKFDVTDVLNTYTGEFNMSKTSTFFFDKQINAFTVEGINKQTWMDNRTSQYIWEQYYSFLGPINMVINGIQTAIGTNENLRQYVLGEALAWRSFAHFKLLQYYAPYKNNEFGIPMTLDPTDDIGNKMPKRETQITCYKQIIGDLNWALELYGKTVVNDNWICAFRQDFINAMLASIYNFKAMSAAAEPTDWENSLKCAEIAMAGRSLSNNPAIIEQMFDCSAENVEAPMTSDEFYFRLMDGYNGQICKFKDYYVGGDYVDGTIPQEYLALYSDNDIRKGVYFSSNTQNKYKIATSDGGCVIPYRLAEMYLIKAEALIRQHKVGEAQITLQAFTAKRYTVQPTPPTGEQNVLDEILKERKREFYMENDFRWLDMKRLGVTREIAIGGELHKLEPNDFRYSFPIPAKEMKDNTNMVQTPGWEKIIIL